MNDSIIQLEQSTPRNSHKVHPRNRPHRGHKRKQLRNTTGIEQELSCPIPFKKPTSCLSLNTYRQSSRRLPLVISDLQTKRLAGLTRERFEEILKVTGTPCRYFCRRSFATWNKLLPSKEAIQKLAQGNIIIKHHKLQPEYMGTRKIKVILTNVHVTLPGHVLASFMPKYSQVENFDAVQGSVGGVLLPHVPSEGGIQLNL